MSFIGIISSRKSFERIKENTMSFIKKEEEDKYNFIHINLSSIKNLRNIKFETIIIEKEISKFINFNFTLRYICENANYILINTDINKEYKNIIINNNNVVLTYGMNQRADVTISSINEGNVLICLQKNIMTKNKKKIEIQENRLKISKQIKLSTYEILIIFTIITLYNGIIINKI